MRGTNLNILYYSAIFVLLLFAAIEYYKEGKKFISFLTIFVALITAWFAFNNIRKSYNG